MRKEIIELKLVSFETSFGLIVSKTVSRLDIDPCFETVFVKDIYKIGVSGNKVYFVFEDGKVFSKHIKFLIDYIGVKRFTTISELIEIAKIIKNNDNMEEF